MIALEVCRSSVTRSRRQFFQFGEEKALTPQIKRPEFGRPQETPHVVSGGLPVDLRNRAAQRFVQPGHVDGDVIISRPGTGLDEGIAQEGQIERYSLGDIPGEIEPVPTLRSAEHTSELQSLMRISYAVF